jgi:murein DD-endopeptidase MepM/ murein hydrolase activator NlpD
MVTQYFHLNYITKGLRKGSRVQQGQLLGGVGKTGLATGTHLHFGMKKNGVYVDPLKQKFQPGKPLPQELMTAFRTQVARWERLLTPVDGALDQAPGHSTFLSNHPNDFPQGAVTQ